MNIPNEAAFAALKMASICATVSFSVTLAPVAAQLMPVGLNTSFCGSMNTAVVAFRFQFIEMPRSGGRFTGGGLNDDVVIGGVSSEFAFIASPGTWPVHGGRSVARLRASRYRSRWRHGC